ncbi:MAG: hypothetical protein IT318_02565 [Anaerolineales bacterium]|nr:hypothetical protein [Anaerolineales bacterium]
MICKLSIVIPGGTHAGAILDRPRPPQVGERIQLADVTVEVIEVTELLPPRGDFRFIHVTAHLVAPTPPASAAPPQG